MLKIFCLTDGLLSGDWSGGRRLSRPWLDARALCPPHLLDLMLVSMSMMEAAEQACWMLMSKMEVRIVSPHGSATQRTTLAKSSAQILYADES